MAEKRRIVLLIDADNAQAKKVDVVLDDLANEGETGVRRAYGDWDDSHLNHWKDVLHERAIRPVQQYALTKGKNASDIALVVDAMDLLHRDEPDVFGLMSSDADFTPLVMHLRDRGADVYGYGDSKSPKPFVNACTKFLHLDKVERSVDEDADSAPDAPVATADLRQDSALVRLLRDAVAGVSDDSGWARAQSVGQRIRNQSSMDPRNYGYASVSKLLKATELFELRDEGTSAFAVRDKREARQAATREESSNGTARKRATKKAAAPKASAKTEPGTTHAEQGQAEKTQSGQSRAKKAQGRKGQAKKAQ